MVAEAKDQSVGASQKACQEDRRNGYAPKVRKPYTITKQREKWTEEEHLKFVEALKLYGRAWRQIEEHVGSKTAIQIRSHAQKFFAKVSRDSSTDVEGSSSPVPIPIPIPPPRPKKKPLHPYPRKTVDPAASPTSVSSAIASDALSANLFTKNDHGPSSKEEEHGFWLSMKISANKSTTKFELFPQETESTSDSPYNISAPYPSIKLFGKTVVVRDSSESSSLGCVVNEKSESNSSQVVFALPWYTWYPYPHAQVVKDEQGSDTWNLGKESSRGFVPHKRCLAASARDGKSLQGRRARVCS